MLHGLALVRTDVSEEPPRATRCNIPEDAILLNADLFAVAFYLKQYSNLHQTFRLFGHIWLSSRNYSLVETATLH
jgi:hypothetical protein